MDTLFQAWYKTTVLHLFYVDYVARLYEHAPEKESCAIVHYSSPKNTAINCRTLQVWNGSLLYFADVTAVQ